MTEKSRRYSGPGRAREALLLAGICVLGAGVRTMFLAGWAANPLFHHPCGDELNFHQTALGLLGLGPEPESFLYQPLYSFYLALVYGLFGPDVSLARTLQLVIGLANICLFYALGRELAGRAAGRLATLLAALYGPFVFFEGQLLAPAIATPLLTGAFLCLIRAGLRERTWLLLPLGVLMGLALMARPNLVVVLPVGGLWWLLRIRSSRGRLVGAGLALAGLVMGMAPSWIHNAIRGQGFVPVSASSGHSFYIGNNPRASGLFGVPRGERIDATSHAGYRRSWIALAEQAEGRELSLSEVSSYWLGRGLDFWAEQPGDALALLGKKLLLAVNSEEMPIHHPYYAIAELVPALKWLLTFGVVFPFAVLGVWLAGRRHGGVGLLAWSFAVYLFGTAVFYVADRYRVMLLPMTIPLAALGMMELAGRARQKGVRSCWPWLLVLAAAFAVTQPSFIAEESRVRARYGIYNLMGKAEGDQGNLEQAERLFRRAILIAGPDHGAVARTNLGLMLERSGETGKALALYRRAAAMDSEYRFVRLRLASLAERAGDPREAIRWWREIERLSADSEPARREIVRLQALLEGSR